MLPPPPPGMKKLGSTNHVMLGGGIPVATQVRLAGLVSFTTKVSSVMSTSGGSEQGGGGGCLQSVTIEQYVCVCSQQQTAITASQLEQCTVLTNTTTVSCSCVAVQHQKRV